MGRTKGPSRAGRVDPSRQRSHRALARVECHDRNHQQLPNRSSSNILRQAPSAGIREGSRQQPPTCVPIRLQTATQNATRALPDDPALADVVDAWPSLPEPIKAAILALVRTAVPSPTHRVSDNSDRTPRRTRKGVNRD